MKIAFRCPGAECRTWNNAAPVRAGPLTVPCRACGRDASLSIPVGLVERHEVDACCVCGGKEFFVRKDFPQRLGLGLVVVFALIASGFYYREQVLATFSTLALLVVIDAVIYFLVGRVTVCYRCRAEYRGVAYNPRHQPFDLATSEKYEQA